MTFIYSFLYIIYQNAIFKNVKFSKYNQSNLLHSKKSAYVNRKHYHLVHVQTICSADMILINVVKCGHQWAFMTNLF